MSKKSKKLRKEFRERGEAMTSFEDLKNSFTPSEHYTKPKESKTMDNKSYKKPFQARKRKELGVNNIVPNPERPNTFSLKANVSATGIPTVADYFNEKGCRFVTLANGTFKKALWCPKNRKLDNGIQALIPVTPTNIIVDYNVDDDVVNVFKINKINESNEMIYMFLYNKFDFKTNKWIKPVFDSLAFIPTCVKEKIETNLESFKINSYEKENDIENTEPKE